MVWFIAVGAVIVLGAACYAVWQERAARRAQHAIRTTASRQTEDGHAKERARPALSTAAQCERRSTSATRTAMSFFTSAFGRGRSIGKCREPLVIV
jgi:type VI protein secretion system component VasK